MKKKIKCPEKCRNCDFYEHLEGTVWHCKYYRKGGISPQEDKPDFCKVVKIEIYEKED